MQDGIIKGTGNSRYLKSISNFLAQYPTYQDFVAALAAGTLPIDLNGINETGWDQLGTALNKANLLSDETTAALGLPNTAVPDDAFRRIPGVGDVVPPQTLRYVDEFGVTLLPCDGQILPAADYPLYAQVQGPLVGYEWNDFQVTGWPNAINSAICLQNGDILLAGSDYANSAYTNVKIYRSTDGGQTMTAVYDAGSYPNNFQFIQKANGKILAVAPQNVYSSTDNGATWTATARSGAAYQWWLTEGENGRIWGVGANSIGYSDDDGVTWKRSFYVQDSYFSGWLNLARLNDGTLVAATGGQNSSTDRNTSYIYCSTDNGENWVRLFERTTPDTESTRINMFASMGKFAVATSEDGYMFFISAAVGVMANPMFLQDGISNTNTTSDTTAYTSAMGKFVYARGSSMFCLDGNWIQTITKTNYRNTRYLTLQDGSVLAWHNGGASPSESWVMKSTQTTDTIILPYKPGWFVRMA